MATSQLSSMLDGVSGRVGNVVYSVRFGKTVIARRPTRGNRQFTEQQLAQQERIRHAGQYVKAVMADPQAKLPYVEAARSRNVPVAGLVSGDFLHAPVVQEIDLSRYTRQAGSKILVLATDDFEVISVNVEIKDANNNLIESGAAVKSTDMLGRWEYTGTMFIQNGQSFSVTAVAADRPGNTGSKTVTVQ